LFTDANVRVDGDAIAAARRAFADPSVGCVCGHLVYVNPNESATASAGARYWSFDEWLKRLESDTGSCVGADGSLFAIRRELFTPVPADIIDDFFTSLSIWCSGWRVVISPELIAYERSASGSREEFRRKVRIACRAFNCHRLLWAQVVRLPAWDLYKYLSHSCSAGWPAPAWRWRRPAWCSAWPRAACRSRPCSASRSSPGSRWPAERSRA